MSLSRPIHQEEPLGTAGALRTIPTPEGIFLALNGDILTTLCLAELPDFMRARALSRRWS
jgi:NDP-sugar pyrophosphorylase family protein